MSSADMLPFLRPDLPPPSGFTVAEQVALAKLDQNECAVAPPPELRSRIAQVLREDDWNRYPQPTHYLRVKERFATAIGERPERVLLTVGGDQVILLAFQAAAGAGRRARIFEPTYPMFAHAARLTQTQVDRVVLGPDYRVTPEALGGPVDLLCLVSPNNPTGDGPDRDLVREALARPALVLLDEAYADYASESAADLVPEHANLLVARSLSKAFLAGVRLGYGIGHPRLVAILERMLTAPYHLNAFQLAVAERVDLVRPLVEDWVRVVVREREGLRAGLASLGLRSWPSRANFVLFEVDDAARVYAGLVERGVRVRNVSSLPGLGQHLRVTVGTPEENALFLEALAGVTGQALPGSEPR